MKFTIFALTVRTLLDGLVAVLALIALSSTGISAAQTTPSEPCRILLKLAGTPTNAPSCLSDYEIYNLEAAGWGRSVRELLGSNSAYAIAAPKSGACNLVGFSQGPNLRRQGAIASCEKQGCDCQIVIDDGRVESFALLKKFEKLATADKAKGTNQDFLNAQNAYQSSMNLAGLSQMKALAEKGDRQAQGFLAQALWSGPQAIIDKSQAAKWAKLAAALGDSAGQNVLGNMHREGFEVAKDPKEAMRFYQLSWGQGYNRAASNIADIHYKGDGVPKGPAEGFKWLKLAAEGGHQPSQLRLGSAYREGDGTPKNDDEAIRLLTPFATQGDAAAMAELADGYRRTFDKKDFSRSFEWASKSAAKGHSGGQEILGQLYLNGQGVERSVAKAIANFRLSAAQNNPWAQNALGRAYENGVGVAQNYDDAARWYLKAAAQGNPDAKASLGASYAMRTASERVKVESPPTSTSQTPVRDERANDAIAREQLRLVDEAWRKAESDAKAREKEYNKLAEESRAKAEADARTKLAIESRLKAEADAKAKLEADAKTKLETDARLKAEADSRARLEAEARIRERERERQLTEAKDAELVALRAQLEKLKQQTAQNNAPVQMAKRRALVIGNDSYRFISKLSNAREDARAVAENLTKVGYTVTLRTDVAEKEMKAAIRTFKSQVEAGDEVAFFYAGHGIQLENTNYLIPIDVAGDTIEQVKDEAIPLQRILDDMADRRAKLTLALIDACRDNPFKSAGRSIGQGRGLAPTTAATGQMVVFSAGTGQQALDNLGPADKDRNGIFTRVFIREMSTPDRTVDAVVRQVRNEVVRMAKSVGHEQVPAIYDQVVGEFYFTRSTR
jgi:TPR repeat protein